jgi:hypothetical protein
LDTAEQSRAEQSNRPGASQQGVAVVSLPEVLSLRRSREREHTPSNKQVHTTHTKRPGELLLGVTNRHNKLYTDI